MKTHCIEGQMEFQGLGKRTVVADFDGGDLTSDAGLLLLREVDQERGVCERLAACCVDHRDQRRIEHSLVDLWRQRVMALACGYEDINDHRRLRGDRMLAVACNRDDITGQSRRRERDRGIALASPSTLNRLELGMRGTAAHHRYKRIHVDTDKLDRLLVDLFVEAYARVPEEVVVDIDATDVQLHGHQEGRRYNAHYGGQIYLPLYITCGSHVLCCRLRGAEREAAHGAKDELARVVAFLRGHWPDVRVIVRGDSGFCRDEIMAWCEAMKGVDYVFGLAHNVRLTRRTVKHMERSRRRMIATGKPSRRFTGFRYRTLESWSRKRRVVAKAEWLAGESPRPSSRFIVTSLSADRWPKHELYEKLYCGRANIENEIKQQQMCLFSDRLSSSVMVANQLRMYVSALAGELLETLRRVGLKQTPMEKARADTTRSRLVKQAATVKVSVRRVVVSMASPSPHQGVFRRAHANLRRHFAMLTRWRQRAAPT